MTDNERELQNLQIYTINIEGSLGLLAYGDLGLRAWRAEKQKNKSEKKKNEEK